MTRAHSARQLLVGLVALPLSLLPFLAYLTWTPEGRLVRDRVLVAVNPPRLPHVSADDVRRGVIPAYGGAVMVLGYHGVGSESDGEGGFVVSPERFGEHLVAMKRAGMNPVTATQVADAFAGGEPLPDRAVMITFDDGRTDAMLFADPLLKQARMKATMFVITSAAEDPGVYYAGWGRLEKAVRSGRWELQAHTHDHHRMETVDGKELPALTSLRSGESIDDYRRRVRGDFAESDRLLRAYAGENPVAFAYPFGAYGADRTNDKRVRDVLRSEVARTYHLAFHQDDQKSIPLATPYDERTALRRLEVADWSAKELMRQISASARRTAAAVEARQRALEAEIAQGGAVPPGLVAGPGPERRLTVGATSRSRPARSGVGSEPSPAPTQVRAPAPAAPQAAYTPPPAPPPSRNPDPAPWTPPDDEPTPPDPGPSNPPPSSGRPGSTNPGPPPDTDAPGRSGEPHGGGGGKPGGGGGGKPDGGGGGKPDGGGGGKPDGAGPGRGKGPPR